MANRKRSHRKELRLNDDELKELEKKMKLTNIGNFRDFINKMIIYGEVKTIDMTELTEIRYLMSTIANNVNQIAIRCNETRSVYETDIHALNFEIKEMRSFFNKVYKTIQKMEL